MITKIILGHLQLVYLLENAIASVLREMVDFKLSCKKREVELQCQIKWAWKHEGILNILLQQSVMASVTEFIHP